MSHPFVQHLHTTDTPTHWSHGSCHGYQTNYRVMKMLTRRNWRYKSLVNSFLEENIDLYLYCLLGHIQQEWSFFHPAELKRMRERASHVLRTKNCFHWDLDFLKSKFPQMVYMLLGKFPETLNGCYYCCFKSNFHQLWLFSWGLGLWISSGCLPFQR